MTVLALLFGFSLTKPQSPDARTGEIYYLMAGKGRPVYVTRTDALLIYGAAGLAVVTFGTRQLLLELKQRKPRRPPDS